MKNKNSDMEWHPAANIFPMLGESELNELADDIKKNGQHEAIVLLDGKVLDGRNRWLACKMRGVEPKTCVPRTPIDDPVAYVISLNLHRRHLTPSQASMCAARARDYYDQQADERMKAGKKIDPPANLPEGKGDARDAAGKAFGVGGKSVDHATRVIKKGIPELAKAVDEGRMAVSTAAIIAADPPEDQMQAIENQANRNYANVTGRKTKKDQSKDVVEEKQPGEVQGVGVRRAYDAIACLKKIPRNDLLRKRGFQIVSDYINQNR